MPGKQCTLSSCFQLGRWRFLPSARFQPSIAGLSVLLFFALGAGTVQAAQEQALSDARVNIGIGAAKPGDPIDIPITLSGGEQVRLGSVSIHVTFPKALLTFTDSERGLAVELADSEVTAVVGNDSEDSSQSSLEVSATGKNPIKPGILAYMKFRVSPDTPKGEITLKLKDYKATAADGGPLQLAQGDNGLLTIFALDEEIPVVGCFFFTH